MLLELILFCVLVYLIYKLDEKPKGLPPGPWGVPVLGAAVQQGAITENSVDKLRAKHGDVFSMRLGSRVLVFLCDFDHIKTSLNNPDIQGRPDFFTLKEFYYFSNIGILFSHGEVWNNSRRFALRQLRDLGLGKTRIQTSIQYEANVLVSHLEKLQNKPTEFMWEVNVAVLNVIWQLVADKHYDINDTEILKFVSLLDENIKLIQGPALILDIFPWLLPILPKFIKNKWMGVDLLYSNRDKFYAFFGKIVDQHRETFDAANPRDFIDQYLLEMEKEKDNSIKNFPTDYMNLYASMADLFAAGSETTSSTLRWMVLLMAKYPEEQKKVQKLIDEVVGDRQPALEDKENLAYVEAMIYEVLRFSSLVPSSIPHVATADVTIAGYSIPKDTIIMHCASICHRNPAYWERPDDFYPPHFLDNDGKLLLKKDGFAPFSLGRRQCLGESLAKAELFLFAAAILQRFTITPAPGDPMDISGVDKNKPRILNVAKPFKVILTVRHLKESLI